MYKSIARVYDYIFPKNRKQLEFIEKVEEITKDEKILDIGCATGNLTSLILEKTVNCEGIDLDEELLYIAKNKKLPVKQLNMLYLDKEFSKEYFDRIVSFGNTLVHLDSREEVKMFFQKVHNLLKNKGLFIVQIINYDRIIDKKIESLPTIDNDEINFVRNYKIIGDKVEFITKLNIKKENLTTDNNIKLLALKKEEIEKMLLETGFGDLEFYGNFFGEKLTQDSEALIFVARKK